MARLWLQASDTIDPSGPHTQAAVEIASWILYKLTAEKYAGTETTTDCYNRDSYIDMRFKPQLINGQMYNIPAETTSGFRNLRLRQSPVLSVIKVEINGQVWDSSNYTLRNNAYLVKKSAVPWIMDSVTDVCVTYRHGTPPPRAGKYAAIRLANELILGAMGSAECALPERVSTVSRQGISMTFIDPQDFISEGRTGLYEVDLFIKAANPDKARKKPRVYSPNRPKGERIN